MKKVLILSVHNPYKTPRGSEKYCIKIIETFKNRIDFDLKYMYNNGRNSKRKNFLEIFYILFFKFKILFVTLFNKYDYVIVNSNMISLFKTKCPIISVQHNDPSIIYTNKFKRLIKRLLFILPSFFNASKIICFDEHSINFFKKNINSKAKYYALPLFTEEVKLVRLKNDQNITYIGAIDNHQKNIDLLDSISKQLNKKINVVTNYNENDFKKEYPSLNFLGYKNRKQIYDEIYPHTSLLILTSNYEGLPFVCIEALSHGIPIAIRDTFITAKWLVDNGNNGILFNKNETSKQIADKLKQHNINKFDRAKIIDFAKKNFNEKKFERIWKQVLGLGKI